MPSHKIKIYDDQAIGMDSQRLVEGNPDLVNNNQVFVRRYLKIYLAITGQWFPHKSSSRLKVLYVLWQLFVCCGVGAYFTIFFVLLLTKIVPTTGVPYFFYYPVTIIEIIMWEFRWLITCYIGVIIYNNAMNHDNYFDSDDSVFQVDKQENALLRDKYWKNVKIFLVVLGMSILLLWIATVTCSLADINFKITRDNFVPFFIEYAIPTLFFRLFAFPLFLLLCVVIFILGSMVKQYSEEIKTWPIIKTESNDSGNGENGARERFRRIKMCIRSAGVSFQLYLTVHFLLLLCTVFLGVCSCFEQLEVRISDNVTISSPLLLAPYSRATGFAGNFSTEDPLILQSVGIQGAQSGVKMVSACSGSPGKIADPKWLTRSITLIFIDMFVKTIESVVLYLVPVILMIRLENQLRHVYEAIEDSNLESQQESRKYLFIDTTKIQTMCRYIKTATGLNVFGYAVPKFNAFMLAAFAPFLAVVIRTLLLHIGMEK